MGDPAPLCYGVGTSTWVDSDALEASQQTFCSNLLVKRGLARREVSNLGTYINEVTFSLEWPENANIGSDECNAMFSFINAGCDGLKWLLYGKKSWKDPNGCHMACVNALSRAIDAGANFANCDMVHKSAHCWEMFSNADGTNGN